MFEAVALLGGGRVEAGNVALDPARRGEIRVGRHLAQRSSRREGEPPRSDAVGSLAGVRRVAGVARLRLRGCSGRRGWRSGGSYLARGALASAGAFTIASTPRSSRPVEPAGRALELEAARVRGELCSCAVAWVPAGSGSEPSPGSARA